MNWLEFIQKSEWPIVVIIVILIFRDSIYKLIERLVPTKFEGFGFKAEFENRLQKAEALTEAVSHKNPENSQAPDQNPTNNNSTIAIENEHVNHTQSPNTNIFHYATEEFTPTSRIIRSYLSFENTLKAYFRQLAPGRPFANRNITDASIGEVIGFSDDEMAAWRELKMIRDKIAHGDPGVISDQEASRFEYVASQLSSRASVLFGENMRKMNPKHKFVDEAQ